MIYDFPSNRKKKKDMPNEERNENGEATKDEENKAPNNAKKSLMRIRTQQ